MLPYYNKIYITYQSIEHDFCDIIDYYNLLTLMKYYNHYCKTLGITFKISWLLLKSKRTHKKSL